jgi:DNA-binding NtrC family response regulator
MTEIPLPKLADRKEDLPLLERYFVDKFATQYNKPISGITRRAQALLARYHWPGNVRELENVIGNACMMIEAGLIDAKDLPTYLRKVADRPDEPQLLSMERVQERHLLQVLEHCGGDKSRAADVLGIARSTLYSILARITLPEKNRMRLLP